MAFALRRRFCQKRCQRFWASKRRISQKTFGGRQDNVVLIRLAGGDRTHNVDDREGRPVIGTGRAVRRLSHAFWLSCRPLHGRIQGAIEQAEAGHTAADQVCMAPDLAIMFDELRAIADRLPSCTPTGAASGGCGPAGRRAGAGATAVVAAASRAMMTMHSFGNVARANPDLFWTPGQSRWAAF